MNVRKYLFMREAAHLGIESISNINANLVVCTNSAGDPLFDRSSGVHHIMFLIYLFHASSFGNEAASSPWSGALTPLDERNGHVAPATALGPLSASSAHDRRSESIRRPESP
jgi:hypothetical protein